MPRGSRDLLKVLANGTNREILTLLRAEPTYPRRLAELVGITEGEAQKRLRLLEEHGLVKGQWVHVGKNVKRYTLEAEALRIEVGPEGLRLALEGAPSTARVTLAPSLEAPPGSGHVVGRAAELLEANRLAREKGTVAIVGIAGTGKTSLAARVAKESQRPVFWTTLRGTEGAPQLLSRLAVFLGSRGLQDVVASYVHLDASHDQQAQVALLTGGLARAQAMVVLDDVHQAKDEALRGVLAALVERAGPYLVVLTGRSLPRGLPRGRLATLDLGGLGPRDTAALLEAHGLPAGPAEAEEVHARTGGHPLALALLAEGARGRGLAPGAMAKLLPETRIEAYLWEEVFADLAPEERAFLGKVAALRGAFDADLAEQVSGDPRARERLFALQRRHLVTPAGEAHRLHDVVRQFAAKLAKPGPEAHRRAAQALEQRGGLADALDALHHRVEAGDLAGAAALARRELEEQPYRFVDQGLGAAYASVLERLAAKARGEDRAVVLLELAKARHRTADAKRCGEALDEAEALLQAKAPVRLRLQLLFLQGSLAHLAGAYEEAARRYTRVLDLADPKAHASLVDEAVQERANAWEDGGHTAKAYAGYLQALARSRRAGDHRRAAYLRGSLARTALLLGKRKEALRHLQEGLAAAGKVDHLRTEANLRRALSEYRLFLGQPDLAWEAAQEYLGVARQLGDPWTVCCALMDEAWILGRLGRWPEAQPMVAEVREVHDRTPMAFFVAQAWAVDVAIAAHHRDWAAFEAKATAFPLEGPAADWYYGNMLFVEIGDRLQHILVPEARPVAERMLRRKDLAWWLRESLEGFLSGKPPPAPRGLFAGVAQRPRAAARPRGARRGAAVRRPRGARRSTP
jgi:DNA-binding transcriptional ArsR family regulator